jgi:hypothetical protein
VTFLSNAATLESTFFSGEVVVFVVSTVYADTGGIGVFLVLITSADLLVAVVVRGRALVLRHLEWRDGERKE